jgi:DNA-binding SARP family transcriptional activator
MSARSLFAAIVALSVAAALWDIRPPFHELAPAGPLSMREIAAYAYVAAWLGLLLASLFETRRLLRRPKKPPRVRSEAVLPARRLPHKSAPFALPVALPRFMLTSPVRHDAPFGSPPRGQETSAKEESENAQPSTGAAVLLLGPLAITGARTRRNGLRAAALELVAYLALHPHGATRDELLEALWPDQDPRKTRGRLYQATRDARRLLGENAITRTKDHYLLDRTHVTTDIDQLESVLETADRCKPDEQIEVLERALALFRGAPLAGSDYKWAEPRVRELRSRLTDLLTRVARGRLDAGDSVSALTFAERGLEIDEFNEELWRLALSSESATGLRGAVEDRYRQLQDVLDQRLGLSPASETRSLYLRLLGQA